MLSLILILASLALTQYRNSVDLREGSGAHSPTSSSCATRSTSTTPTRASIRSRSTRSSRRGTCAAMPQGSDHELDDDTWQTVQAEADAGHGVHDAGDLRREERLGLTRRSTAAATRTGRASGRVSYWDVSARRGAAPISSSSVTRRGAGEGRATSPCRIGRPTSRTVACPSFVSASVGSMVPSVVENKTTVPSWTGVPTPGVTSPWRCRCSDRLR